MAHNLRMLCVDDNIDLLTNLAEQFRNEEFLVDTADDGDVALELIKANNYDIILLDVHMKRVDGITVLHEMKKLNKHPYVIMISAVNEVAMADECVSLGATDYISKPYDPEELLHIVIKVLGSHSG